MNGLHALLVAPFETLGFMRTALVACIALSLTNGVIGTMLLLRRMSLEGDVLAHAVMPGAAIGFLYAGPSPVFLSLGGLGSGLLVAGLAGVAGPRVAGQRASGQRAQAEGGLIAFYLAALALGVVLVAWRGSNADIMHVLFGTVLAIDRPVLLQIAVGASMIVLAVAALYRPLAAEALDPGFLRLAGNRMPYGAIFLVLVVVALVAGFQAFGTLMAVGPLLLPAAAARCFRAGVGASMALAVLFGAVASVAGLLLSYHRNLPSGPLIVLAGALLFAVSLLASRVFRSRGFR